VRQLSGQSPAQVDCAALRFAEEQLEAILPEIRTQGPERRPPEVQLHAPRILAARAASAMVNLDQAAPSRAGVPAARRRSGRPRILELALRTVHLLVGV
jgi:hypothetical protein